MEDNFWEEVRDEFPVTNHLAYFQSAGMSPIPNQVLRKINEAYLNINQFGDMHFGADLQRSDELRAKLADMINTNVANIAFSHNTSTAFSFIAAALKHSMPFDFNLVSLKDEFPSTNVPFEFQGIPVKFVEPVKGSYSLESILDAIDEKTMGVVCSHVQYSTGFRLDIEKLGKALAAMDMLFIVNATQSFPYYEIDVEKMHIDVLTASFHKWGLSGIAGALFYTSESFRRGYPNSMAGWLGVVPPEGDFIPTQKNEGYKQFEHAGQYNFGTSNFQVLAGLDCAMDYINNIGREKIRNRIIALTDYLIEKMRELPVEIITPVSNVDERSPILLINMIGTDNAEAVKFLEKNKVVTSIRAGNIRISCNIFNNFKEIDQLANTLGLFAEM